MSSQYSTRIFLGFGLFLVGVIGIFGLVRYAKNPSSSESGASSPVEQLADLPAGVYAAYAGSNTVGSKEVQVRLYNLANQGSQVIGSYPLGDEIGGANLQFKQYGGGILVRQEDVNYLLTLDGRVHIDFIDPGALPFVFSADKKKLAYLRESDVTAAVSGENMVDFQLVLQDVSTAEEKSISVGSGQVAPGLLTPLLWSADGQFLYAEHRQGTEGYPTGLVRINTENLEQEPVSVVEKNGLVNFQVDAQNTVYALRESDIDNDKGAARFVRVSVDSGEVQEFSVPELTIEHLVSVSADGRFVAYEIVPGDVDFSSLWVYDMQKKEAFPVSMSGALVDNVKMSGQHLLFQESYSGGSSGAVFYLTAYDMLSRTSKEITSVEQTSGIDPTVLQPIGWFDVLE